MAQLTRKMEDAIHSADMEKREDAVPQEKIRLHKKAQRFGYDVKSVLDAFIESFFLLSVRPRCTLCIKTQVLWTVSFHIGGLSSTRQ